MIANIQRQSLKKTRNKSIRLQRVPRPLRNQSLDLLRMSPKQTQGSFKPCIKVIREIGKGSFGTVYLVEKQGRQIAAKLYSKKGMSQQALANALTQIQILKKIQHESIIKLLDYQESQSSLILYLEFFQGQSLENMVKNQELADQSQIRLVFCKLVHALHYLHSNFIVHRDLKANNILVNHKRQIRLIDFGFATDVTHRPKLTMFCGTPAYMAPQIINKKFYKGQPVDLWALGIILYFMMQRQLPYRAPSQVMLYNKIKKGLYQKPKGISEGGKYLIEKLLEQNPANRGSIDQVAQDTWLQPVNISQKLKQLRIKMSQSESK